MLEIFYTLQDFMLHAKSMTYITMGVVLVALGLFWRFLTTMEDENQRTF